MRELGKRVGPLKKLKPKYRFWLESEDGYVFGHGSFDLLKGIQETGSLSGSARATGMSYRYAWGIIKQIEKRVGTPIVETHKGGKRGGGSKLTPTGRALLETYQKYTTALDQLCEAVKA